MMRFVLPIMLVGGVILTGPAASLAASAVALAPGATAQTAIQQVDYYWNHHHYKHRRWDKAHKRWNYY